MKAIILAGGEGMRLRPLTCTVPKPLLPLCGRPCAEYILDLLARHGYDEAVFTVSYRAELIQKHFSSEEYSGISLSFSDEKEPMGTAGSVKCAAVNISDDIIVISGDALCDLDLTAARLYHKRMGADVTIITKSVDDPREYGLVSVDEQGRITCFYEKPSFEGCTSELANTGVYLISASVFGLIPTDKPSDFAKDIFPYMLSKGMKLYSFTDSGYWCDIGNLRDYIKCQRAMLEGSVGCDIHAHRELSGIYSAANCRLSSARVEPPVYIGRNVTIGENAQISDGSVICDNVHIGKNAKVKGSIVMSGAYIGDRASCCEAVVCEGARLLEGAAAYEFSALGAKSVVGRGAVVESGVRIWANKVLESGACAGYDIKHGTTRPLVFGEDGISGETGGEILPHNAVRIGMALTSVSKRIVIGFSSSEPSEVYALALASGIASGGADALTLGSCPESAVDFAVVRAGAGCGVYIDARTSTKFRFVSGDGLNITRDEERKIETALRDGCACSMFGKLLNFEAVSRQYEYESCLSVPKGGLLIKPELSTSGNSLSAFKKAVYGIEACGDLTSFSISSDCRRLSAYSESTGFVSYDKLIMLCCLQSISEGKSVALPESFPEAADKLCSMNGVKAVRYAANPTNSAQFEARRAASKNPFVRDAILALSMVLRYLSENRLTLSAALKRLPEFATLTRSVSIDCPPGKAIKSACNGYNGKIRTEQGIVTLRPSRTGKSIYILAEAYNTETAAELCGFYERKLSSKTPDSE